MKKAVKVFGILMNTVLGENNESFEEEMALADAVTAWEREVWPLIEAEARRELQEERLAYLNQQHELMMEYLGA